MTRQRYVLIAVLIILVAGSGIYLGFTSGTFGRATSTGTSSTAVGSTGVGSSTVGSSASASCSSIQPEKDLHLSNSTFDAVTEFTLPTPTRGANAILVAPDGSVWFGEESIPGIGHLYANGTLNEYAWPTPANAPSGCPSGTNIWGIALWNGSVWATDSFGSRIVGLDPSTGASVSINVTAESFPYALATGPNNGSLWFTELFGGASVGEVLPNLSVKYFSVPVGSGYEGAYILFKNSTLGYLLEINPDTSMSSLLSFDPASSSPTFSLVGGNVTLYDPSSIAIGEGGIWLTEHSATAMAFFNSTSGTWTIYPLSSVPFVNTDLSYFDDANATTVWFNEHYANRMGEISNDATDLTEYSVSNPPVTTESNITNAISVALGAGKFWFTEWTGNEIGFINQSYVPPFSVSTNSSTVQLAPGGSAQVEAVISGHESNLSLEFEDNEVYNATPIAITFTPSVKTLSVDGSQQVTVSISAASSLKPGEYVGAITVVYDGLIYRSVYVHIDVTS